MAKRKRLGVVDPLRIAEGGALSGLPGPADRFSLRAPVAQVAGDSAVAAAFEEVAGALREARDEGRLILALPLSSIVADHLIRDRMTLEDEALSALKQSLISRGQQTPVEVTALPPATDGSARYGLISGWRRLMALRALAAETQEARFGQILALVRRPRDQVEAYVAMVEENEIRADLSFFERARIVEGALQAGVYDTEKEALQSLFAAAPYARRSKIKSFLAVVRQVGDVLRFPAHLSERRGLAMAAALTRDAGTAARIAAAVRAADPATPEAEARALDQALSVRPRLPPDPAPPEASLHCDIGPDLTLTSADGWIALRGAAATSDLAAALRDWLRGRG